MLHKKILFFFVIVGRRNQQWLLEWWQFSKWNSLTAQKTKYTSNLAWYSILWTRAPKIITCVWIPRFRNRVLHAVPFSIVSFIIQIRNYSNMIRTNPHGIPFTCREIVWLIHVLWHQFISKSYWEAIQSHCTPSRDSLSQQISFRLTLTKNFIWKSISTNLFSEFSRINLRFLF